MSPVVCPELPTVFNDVSGAAGPDELYNQSIVISSDKKTYYGFMATKICVFSAAIGSCRSEVGGPMAPGMLSSIAAPVAAGISAGKFWCKTGKPFVLFL